MNELSCECPEAMVVDLNGPSPLDHEPQGCDSDYDIQLYRRNGVEMWLCGYCVLIGDVCLSRSEAPA